MKKTIPTFASDTEAADFVANADLGAYNLKGQMVTFELRPKDKTVSLRLPDALLEKIRNRAATIGMPTQRFMRLALEKAVIDDLKR